MGAETIAWHAAMMMTTELGFRIEKQFSMSTAFFKLLGPDGVHTRRAKAILLGCRGSVLELSEYVLKRAFAMKYVRTALLKMLPNMEFENSQARADVNYNEFTVGTLCRFSSDHDCSRRTFQEIQRYLMNWYNDDPSLHPLQAPTLQNQRMINSSQLPSSPLASMSSFVVDTPDERVIEEASMTIAASVAPNLQVSTGRKRGRPAMTPTIEDLIKENTRLSRQLKSFEGHE